MNRDDDSAWIQTYTGRKFWPLSPSPDDVHIEDIAHALSLMCRFGGHCRDFYSVAQHSVLVASLLVTKEWKLAALLHDASEAYMADVLRPIKASLSQLHEVEKGLEICISQKFGTMYPLHEHIKYADMRLLATEKRDLMILTEHPWQPLPHPLSEKIIPWSPKEAEKRFLSDFQDFNRDMLNQYMDLGIGGWINERR